MKNLIHTLLFILFGLSIQAQSFNYQTIVRNGSGSPQVSTPVNLRFTVLETSTSGVLYRETHNPTTDQYGWLSLTIGNGIPVTGTFATVDFSVKRYLLVECSTDGGSNFAEIGVSELSPSGTGPKGDKGDTGLKGDQGSKGDKGDIGAKGDQGIQGVAGPKGDQGEAGTGVKIVGSLPDASTLPVPYAGLIGDMYITQNDGNGHVWSGTAWTNVGQIKGPKGDTGATGAIGPKGDKGDAGISFALPYTGNSSTSGTDHIFQITQTGNGGPAISGIYGARAVGGGIGRVGIEGTSNISTGVAGSSSAGSGYAGVTGIGYNRAWGVTGLGTGSESGGGSFEANGSGIAGYFSSVSGHAIVTGTGNVGIGVSDPSTKLDVNGQIKISGGVPGIGKVLTSDELGLASWQTPIVVTDSDNQTLSLTGNQLSISNGNTVTLPSTGGGSLNGSGTIGSLTRWINGTTLGDAAFMQDLESNIGLGTIPQTAYKMKINSTAGSAFPLNLSANNVPGSALHFSLNDATQKAEIQLQSAVTNFRTTSEKLAFNARSASALPLMADHLAIKSNGQVTMGLFDPYTSGDRLSVNGNVGLKDASLNFYDDSNVGAADISCLAPDNKLHIHSNKNNAGIEIISTGGKIEMATNGIGGATSELVVENGKVIIGNSSAISPKLEVLGQLKINGGSPGAGKVLTSDAAGLASWQLPTSTGTGLWNNNLWAPTLSHNTASIKQVLISPLPESVAVLDNTVLTVAAQTENSVANFITQNTATNSKMVKIHNQGTASGFTNPLALDILNRPYLDSGNGIKIDVGGTGLDVLGDLGAIRAKSLNISVAGVFEGGGAITALGRHTGVSATSDLSSNTSVGVRANYSGTGNFNGIGIEATSLPTNAQIRESQGFGIGGKFVGGNKGISVESLTNPSSTYLLDLQFYTKIYGAESRPMAGLFKSHSSVGIMAVSSDLHAVNGGESYGIGVVGRSNAIGTSATTIGVYGEGEGNGSRIGVMGHSAATTAGIAIGIKGTADGSTGVAGDFRAAEGIHIEGTNIGIHSIAPTNEFVGSSTTQPIVRLQHFSANGGTALEIQNGYIKVDQGSNTKTAFKHVTASSNITGNATILNFPNQKASDIIMINRGLPYINRIISFYTWFDAVVGKWKIAIDDNTTMPAGWNFSVIVIKTE